VDGYRLRRPAAHGFSVRADDRDVHRVGRAQGHRVRCSACRSRGGGDQKSELPKSGALIGRRRCAYSGTGRVELFTAGPWAECGCREVNHGQEHRNYGRRCGPAGPLERGSISAIRRFCGAIGSDTSGHVSERKDASVGSGDSEGLRRHRSDTAIEGQNRAIGAVTGAGLERIGNISPRSPDFFRYRFPGRPPRLAVLVSLNCILNAPLAS